MENKKKLEGSEKKIMMPSMLWKQKLMECYLNAASTLAFVSSMPKYDQKTGGKSSEYEEAYWLFQSQVIQLWSLLRLKSSNVLSKEEAKELEQLDEAVSNPHVSRTIPGAFTRSQSFISPINFKRLYGSFKIMQGVIAELGLTKLEKTEYGEEESMA